MGLIIEGISDCISSIESMVTGEFSWKSWAIEKAISIGLSLIGFGVGKLIAKGFKASKVLMKGLSKKLKLMPKFLSRQAKEGLSAVTKTNMRNAFKLTAKTMVTETIIYGFGKAEEALLREILNGIKNEVKKKVVGEVKSNMEKEPLAALVDSIILSHLQDKQQLSNLVQDNNKKNKLLTIFKELSNSALQPFYADLSWQKKLNSSISSVINSAKSKAKGTTRGILIAIQTIHMTSLAADAISTVLSLSDKFFSNLKEQLNKFKTEKGFSEKVKPSELSASQTDLLKEFKQDLADTISALLTDAIVEVFHQKFSSHIVSHVQGTVHGVIGHYVKTGLNSDRTEEKLRAGQNNRYIAHMPVDLNYAHRPAEESGRYSQSHAEKIKNSTTAGTILDVKVLSETTGTKVVILTENSHGKLTKMQELNPGSKPASQTVTLIYRAKSAQYPDGHYDVRINDQTVSVTSKDKSCLFHALARGLKPEAGEEEITVEADRLRSMEADTLLRHQGQWEPFIKRKEWTEVIRGGDWYMAEGAAPKRVVKRMVENKKVLKKEVGKIEKYKDWKKYATTNVGIGQFINADHQPPVSSILQARKLNQNSKLAEAMLEVATKSSPLSTNLISNVQKYHGLELPTVYVPHETHREFPSTKSKTFRTTLATAISKDDVVGTFKLTILGAMPRFMVYTGGDKVFKNFKQPTISKTRLDAFQKSFQQHSLNMVQRWSTLLQGKGVMNNNHVTTITTWINNKGYMNQNDPNRNLVSSII
ncbi:uncharacterized protein [Salminus brasiliensis]|uniref:uncharacterized protein n=1 Tax=Salminus brasiliensis TaxID=930266 RepID=UPI003B8343CF